MKTSPHHSSCQVLDRTLVLLKSSSSPTQILSRTIRLVQMLGLTSIDPGPSSCHHPSRTLLRILEMAFQLMKTATPSLHLLRQIHPPCLQYSSSSYPLLPQIPILNQILSRLFQMLNLTSMDSGPSSCHRPSRTLLRILGMAVHQIWTATPSSHPPRQVPQTCLRCWSSPYLGLHQILV